MVTGAHLSLIEVPKPDKARRQVPATSCCILILEASRTLLLGPLRAGQKHATIQTPEGPNYPNVRCLWLPWFQSDPLLRASAPSTLFGVGVSLPLRVRVVLCVRRCPRRRRSKLFLRTVFRQEHSESWSPTKLPELAAQIAEVPESRGPRPASKHAQIFEQVTSAAWRPT